MNRKRVLALSFIFTVAALLLAGIAFQNRNSVKLLPKSAADSDAGGFDPSTKGLAIGTKLDPVTMVSLQTGRPVELFAENGEQSPGPQSFTVIVFFSTTCPGCTKDMQYWRNLVTACGKRGVNVYLATFDSELDTVQHFVNTFEFADLPVLYNGQRERIAGLFDIDIVPTTYIFRGTGQLVAKYLGLRWYKEGKELSGDAKLEEVLVQVGG